MRQSQIFPKVLKQAPKDEISTNAKLLRRAGFVYKELAGVYTYLPLGLRVLRKIEGIIRKEMEELSAQEVLMSVFQPKNLWQETGRWSKEIGEVMYKARENKKEIGLGPTHEEMLTDIIRHFIKSYQDLPLYIYQIQTKFRKELRPKAGLLRGREFDMKDLYSFHSSDADFKKYYERVIKSYSRILKKCGLEPIITEASGKGFTKGFTHEFQVLSRAGEDTIVYCPSHHFSQNKEISKFKAGDKCPVCKKTLREGKSIEVGNIFPLGTKYSKAMKAFFVDKRGKKKPIIMGCYGLGISRIMGAIVEVHHDEKGIIWPKEVAPFDVHLLALGGRKKIIKNKIKRLGERLYNDLKKEGIEVLYDDREEKSAGQKLAIADLIGIPYRVIISEKTLEKNSLEIKKRTEKRVKLIKITNLPQFFKSAYVK